MCAAECIVVYSRMHRCVQKSVQFCRVVLSCVQQWSNRDQAGNEQGEIKFWIDSAIRCHRQAIISFHQLSWANSHHLSWVSCHDLKKAGKVDQTGRNSGLTTDGQTDRLGHKCGYWSATSQLKMNKNSAMSQINHLKDYLVFDFWMNSQLYIHFKMLSHRKLSNILSWWFVKSTCRSGWPGFLIRIAMRGDMRPGHGDGIEPDKLYEPLSLAASCLHLANHIQWLPLLFVHFFFWDFLPFKVEKSDINVYLRKSF